MTQWNTHSDLVFLLYAVHISSQTQFTRIESFDPTRTSPFRHTKQATFNLSSAVREWSRSVFNNSVISQTTNERAGFYASHHVEWPYNSVYCRRFSTTKVKVQYGLLISVFLCSREAKQLTCLQGSSRYLLSWSTSFLGKYNKALFQMQQNSPSFTTSRAPQEIS